MTNCENTSNAFTWSFQAMAIVVWPLSCADVASESTANAFAAL